VVTSNPLVAQWLERLAVANKAKVEIPYGITMKLD